PRRARRCCPDKTPVVPERTGFAAVRTDHSMTTKMRSAPFATEPAGADPEAAQQMRQLLAAMNQLRNGGFGARLPSDWAGLPGKLADAYNDIAQANQRMANELERIGQAVGRQGRTRQRASFGGRGGAWESMEGSVNALIDDLLWPTERMT